MHIMIKNWNDNGKMCKMTAKKCGKTCKIMAKKHGKTCKLIVKKYVKVCKMLISGRFYAILYLESRKGGWFGEEKCFGKAYRMEK